MIIPLSNETLYFDWSLTTLDGKEIPFEVIVKDMEQKKEILTSGEELDAFCRTWNINNPVKQFQIFTELAISEKGNPVEKLKEMRSILRTFWYLQPSDRIKKLGSCKLKG